MSQEQLAEICSKESISDENILDDISINKVEIWRTEDQPRYWTVIFFTSTCLDFPHKLSKVMIDRGQGGNWFCDFKCGNVKYIVFHNKVLTYEICNQEQKEKVKEECIRLGISKEQMNWEE